MPTPIYVSPGVTSAIYIKVAGQCYRLVGPSSQSPDTSSIDSTTSGCDDSSCSSTSPCGNCTGFTMPSKIRLDLVALALCSGCYHYITYLQYTGAPGTYDCLQQSDGCTYLFCGAGPTATEYTDSGCSSGTGNSIGCILITILVSGGMFTITAQNGSVTAPCCAGHESSTYTFGVYYFRGSYIDPGLSCFPSGPVSVANTNTACDTANATTGGSATMTCFA